MNINPYLREVYAKLGITLLVKIGEDDRHDVVSMSDEDMSKLIDYTMERELS